MSWGCPPIITWGLRSLWDVVGGCPGRMWWAGCQLDTRKCCQRGAGGGSHRVPARAGVAVPVLRVGLVAGRVCGRPPGPDPLLLPPAVSSQKRLQARPQQPAPSVPGCAAQLPARPPARRLCPERHPWQQRGPSCGCPRERSGRQGQPGAQPQCRHPCPLRTGCGPAGPQWAPQCPAPAPQRPAWGGKWRRGQQRRRRGRRQAERCHQ